MHQPTKHIWSYLSLYHCVFVSICLALSPLLFLIDTAFAQSTSIPETSASTTNLSTSSTATSTPSATATTQTASAWYQSEQISGSDIDIAIGDFVVGPGKIEVIVKPGQTVTQMMTVTNRISGNKKFELTVEDMSGSADPTVPVVLLGDKNGPYTLKDNISFGGKTFTLGLGERAQIPVNITMPADAEPGGYYGAVLVSTIQDDNEAGEAVASSPIVARIGSLFFITVPGAIDQQGQVTDFSTIPKKWFFDKGPLNLGILFENTGSKHLNPYGELTINNLFGEEVGFVTIDPWFVLPKSLRLREVVWDREVLFGRYTITAKINRGYEDVVDEKNIHIWVLPWQFLVSVFFGVFVLILCIRFIGSRFEFKRKQ